jgi:hypothetical protein
MRSHPAAQLSQGFDLMPDKESKPTSPSCAELAVALPATDHLGRDLKDPRGFTSQDAVGLSTH